MEKEFFVKCYSIEKRITLFISIFLYGTIFLSLYAIKILGFVEVHPLTKLNFDFFMIFYCFVPFIYFLVLKFGYEGVSGEGWEITYHKSVVIVLIISLIHRIIDFSWGLYLLINV
ncbi:MAG: hypothetical protein ACFFDN_30885 [Candidatus Hodarchaeota archaeon]